MCRRQILIVPRSRGGMRSARSDPARNLLEPFDQHGVVQIGGDNLPVRSHAQLDKEGSVCRVRADIDCSPPCQGRYVRRRDMFPAVMEPETQEGIVEIVHAGDRREHSLHGLFTRSPTTSRRPAPASDIQVRGARAVPPHAACQAW